MHRPCGRSVPPAGLEVLIDEVVDAESHSMTVFTRSRIVVIVVGTDSRQFPS